MKRWTSVERRSRNMVPAFNLHRLHRTHIILAIIDDSQALVYSDPFLVFELRGFRLVFRSPENHRRPMGVAAADSRCCTVHGDAADTLKDIRERLFVTHRQRSRQTIH